MDVVWGLLKVWLQALGACMAKILGFTLSTDMGLLAKPQAIWTHDPGIFETNQDSQKVGVDNKLVSTWNILEIHTAKHSVGFSLSTCCITKQI